MKKYQNHRGRDFRDVAIVAHGVKELNSINPLDHLVCFAQPLRLDNTSAWIEHVPFGMFMIDLLRPNVLVELGTHTGVSYSAFCQAVRQLGLETRCYAVDTWEGDVHAGYYGASVLADLRAYHDPLYGEFSRLLQNTFDNAVKYFSDGSIDLLHIDGLHTYEAVKHDFETWLPKLSERGVVLFHDTNVRERDFGVWKLWVDLKQQFPSFEFVHGHGLGVLRVGDASTPALEPLFSMTGDQSKRIKAFFFTLGSRLSNVTERDGRIASLNEAVAERDGRIARLTEAVAERDGRIARLTEAVAERDGRIAGLNRSVTKRDGEIERLNQAMAARDKRISNLNQAGAKRDVMLHAMRSSTSWRVTAPLRFVKTAASSLYPRRILRKAVSLTATSLYRGLPLSVGWKVKLKGWLFSAFPFLFGDTAAYRNWLVSSGQQPAPAHMVPEKTQIAPLARPASDIVHETCPPSVTKYLDDLFVRAQRNPGGSLTYVPLAADSLDAHRLDVKLIAFYLPQYHPIPENDRWWGNGFTEWTNVSKAIPQFVGHYQPRLPGELGFYDLRVPDVQRRQIELAKTYGIYGFCYHHYWFAGTRLLETPFNQVLANPELDLPFCLCWANENWTRRWDGLEQEVLIAQGYSEEDDFAFIRDIERALRDPRYIRIDERPLLIVYRVSQLPDARATANRWRTYCKQNGIGDLFLVAARSFDITDPRPYGFDAAVQFPPHQTPVPKITNEKAIVNSAYSGNIFHYQQMARVHAETEVDGYPMFRCVMPGWDNEARRPGKGDTFAHSSPEAYAEWLDQACIAATRAPPSQRLVFVNAWNEWGEGAYLEPDRMYGYAYLHATTNVLRGYVRSGNAAKLAAETRHAFRKKSDVAVILHLYYEDLLSELYDSFLINVQTSDLFVTVRPDVSEETIRDLLGQFPNAYVSMAQNRGRDILPFLGMITLASTLGYEVGCKIHTKKSTHRSDGTTLRTRLVGELIGTRHRVDQILSSFRADPKLGMVVPQGSRLPLLEECLNMSNRKWLNEMLPRLGRSEEIDLYRFHFPAGSMFWFRPAALTPLMQLRLQPDHFERELGQLDGTLAHTIERLFELSAEVAGYRVTDTRSIGAPCEAHDMVIGA